jgi:hypothetical protein
LNEETKQFAVMTLIKRNKLFRKNVQPPLQGFSFLCHNPALKHRAIFKRASGAKLPQSGI